MNIDVIIVGGGLAGLTAANYLAREGLQVHLFEKSQHVGGRAVTKRTDGFALNLGPHAVFVGRMVTSVLAELGVSCDGGEIDLNGNYVYRDGKLYDLPTNLGSMLGTKAISFSEKLNMARLMMNIPRQKASDYTHTSIETWLNRQVDQPALRDLMYAILRLGTYSNAFDYVSADLVIDNFQNSGGGVRYIHGGWQTMVDGLRAKAEEHGVIIHENTRLQEVVIDDGMVQGIMDGQGTFWRAHHVLLAIPPQQALEAVPNAANMAWGHYASQVKPAQAATLDLGLRRLPNPKVRIVLGVDQPLYYSVHSTWAKLAPQGGAMIHLAKYLPNGTQTSPNDRAELEAFMDFLQPGWRDEVVVERFLPHITIMNAMPSAAWGGLTGRPLPQVGEVQGLYLAGDWVGHHSFLAEAVTNSAKTAAQAILQNQAIMV